jgi:hypothetical protein
LGGAPGESAWTAVMILTYMFALMGIQCSPAFTMWTFGIKSPKPLAWQQAFMSTFVVGFALFFFHRLSRVWAPKCSNWPGMKLSRMSIMPRSYHADE